MSASRTTITAPRISTVTRNCGSNSPRTSWRSSSILRVSPSTNATGINPAKNPPLPRHFARDAAIRPQVILDRILNSGTEKRHLIGHDGFLYGRTHRLNAEGLATYASLTAAYVCHTLDPSWRRRPMIHRRFATRTLFGWLSGGLDAATNTSTSISYPAPKHREEYGRRFRSRIKFDAEVTRALVESPSLNMPVKSNDNEFRELCIRHCSHFVRPISRNGPVASRLRSALTTMGTIPALENAAETLHMSPRSLRRHLKEQTASQRSVRSARGPNTRRHYSRSVAMII